MRLVVHVGGGSGHLRPVVPIAVGWKERGHEVVVAAGGAVRAEAESYGLEFAEPAQCRQGGSAGGRHRDP